MFDLPQARPDVSRGPPVLQRARGHAAIGYRDGKLKQLSQSGSAKVMTPACHGQSPEAVFLNTAGGLTGGDRFTFSASVEDGALFLTTQTAERAYACA
ncbi:MAG: urease accessory protein UreD, partial [Pseudomonadota bacterium]